MKKLLFMSALALMVSANAANAAADKDPVEGYWLTQTKRSVILIEKCQDSLCGWVYWLAPDAMSHDDKNPDEAKRSRPMCGLPIIWGFEKDGVGEWEDGKIYKADDGDLYDAKMEILDDGNLKVRGYMGISMLGKSQVWTPADPKNYPKCKPAK